MHAMNTSFQNKAQRQIHDRLYETLKLAHQDSGGTDNKNQGSPGKGSHAKGSPGNGSPGKGSHAKGTLVKGSPGKGANTDIALHLNDNRVESPARNEGTQVIRMSNKTCLVQIRSSPKNTRSPSIIDLNEMNKGKIESPSFKKKSNFEVAKMPLRRIATIR